MILTAEQMNQAVHGHIDRELLDGYCFFYRFTKAQRDYYKNTKFTPKERASSAMYLEFITDAREIRFEYRQDQASSQTFFFFDLYIDGKMVTKEGQESYTSPYEGIYEAILPAGIKTVRIYFPNLSATGIRNLDLVKATFCTPTKRTRRSIAYGDSITQGYTSLSPSLTYVNLIGEALDAEMYDLGIGGECFEPKMIDEHYPIKADFVTVAYGTNDWSHCSPKQDEPLRKGFFEKLVKAHGDSKIFVLLPIWRGNQNAENEGYGPLENYRNLLREELKIYPQITVIEGENLVPHHPDFFMPDLLHPNALGFTQYAKNLLTELKKYL